MTTNNVVLVHHFCLYHQVEKSFIEALHEYDLISIQIINDEKYLSNDDLKDIEKMVTLHQDLGINLEGIDVILRLIAQNNSLKKELESTTKKLNLYKSEL